MEQLGDKIMDGFGLQCFTKTRCLPSLILLPEATCLIFALQKPINKGRRESISDGDTPSPFGKTADLPSTPGGTHPTRVPRQVQHALVPVGPILPPHGSTPRRPRCTTKPHTQPAPYWDVGFLRSSGLGMPVLSSLSGRSLTHLSASFCSKYTNGQRGHILT